MKLRESRAAVCVIAAIATALLPSMACNVFVLPLVVAGNTVILCDRRRTSSPSAVFFQDIVPGRIFLFPVMVSHNRVPAIRARLG